MKKDPQYSNKISSLRTSINGIDSAILNLLSKRRKLSLKILKEKKKVSKPVRELEREQEVLNRIILLAEKKKLNKNFVLRIFKDIIEDSVNYQEKFIKIDNVTASSDARGRVAIQGIDGSFSSLAAKKYFGAKIELVSKKSFAEAVNSVEQGESDFALLPIDNTTSGGINEVHDLLLNTSLTIIGEEYYKINHCLAAEKKVPLKSIKKIFAHYQAEAQCSNFISSLNDCSIEYFPDTAMSFKKIKEEKNIKYAAIAGEEAAGLYGLKILKRGIANQAGNFTRFIIASRNPVNPEKEIPAKTSIIMTTSNKSGSLSDALSVFKRNKINLTRIESRPVKGNPWDEMFYIDFIGNINDRKIKHVLKEVEKKTIFLKILGCYKSGKF